MNQPTYRVAEAAASVIQNHFTDLHSEARHRGVRDLAPLIEADAVQTVVEAGFWASLRREEGRTPKISLAFLPPEQSGSPLVFARRIPLNPRALTRLAPAVERPGIHLGVWREENEFYVWGATRTIPDFCFVLEVVEPGLLVVKRSRPDKFANVAVLEGDRIKLVDQESVRRPDCPELVASLAGIERSKFWLDDTNALMQLAVSMRAHGHGGSLLIVPRENGRWRESIVSPMQYHVLPTFSRLAKLIRAPSEERSTESWQQDFRQAVTGIGGLTAVDGAMIMNEDYELIAFGAKIKRAEGSTAVDVVSLTEPVAGNEPQIVDADSLGGTRHLSAAQFVHDQHEALSLVASQDGGFTVFAWSELDERVHAHRIEILLL